MEATLTLLCVVWFALFGGVAVMGAKIRKACKAPLPPHAVTELRLPARGSAEWDAAEEAATRLQAAARGGMTRVVLVRLLEVAQWENVQRRRRGALALAYGIVVSYVAFVGYLNLIFGIVFTKEQMTSWLIASAIALAVDAGISKPGGIFAKTAAALFVYRTKAKIAEATLEMRRYAGFKALAAK